MPLLGRHPAELARLVPQLDEPAAATFSRSPAGDPDTDQHRLFDAVADWLRSVTSVVPLLLVLDDLHWATRPTLQLLRHLIQVLDPVPLLMVGTYRDTESGRRRSLDELLADSTGCRMSSDRPSSGLSADDVVDLLAGGHRPGRWRLRPGRWSGPSGPRPEATPSSPASSSAISSTTAR